MLDRKKIIIISAIILLVILLFLFFFWLIKKPTTQPNANANLNANQNINAALSQLPSPSEKTIKQEKDYPLGLEQLANSFAERFGSYSTDSQNKNLTDLKPFMTIKMQAEADKMIAANNGVGSFQGFDTKALTTDLVAVSASQAVVVVKTQRTRYTEIGGEPSISYSDLRLKLVKVGADWQVDEASWQ